jgi:hypothetical protein
MENEDALLAEQADFLDGHIPYHNLYRVPIAREIKNVINFNELHATLYISDTLNPVHHCSRVVSIPGFK